jgi:outer membrane protein assembly factor BamB
MRKRFLVGFFAAAALLVLIVGSIAISALTRQIPGASANALPGVYVGAGDGTLYKLDSARGTAIWHSQVTDQHLPAPPVVDNGIAYLTTLDGDVYALNAANGHTVWRYQTGGNIIAAPVVANNVVYAGSTDNDIYAMNAQNGALLWRFNAAVGNESVAPGGLFVADGVVYGTASDQIDHSYLFAINAGNGTLLWRIKVRDQLFTGVQDVNNVLYLASSAIAHEGGPVVTNSYVYAYNAATGKRLWISSAIGDLVLSTPTVANNVVYAGSQDAAVFALDAQTGARLWRHQLGGPIYSSPVVANGVLYAGIASNPSAAPPNKTSDTTTTGGSIVALDAVTGNLIWQQTRIGDYAGAPLALFGHMLYVGATDNMVYALDITGGSIVWSYQMTSANPFNNAPVTVAS